MGTPGTEDLLEQKPKGWMNSGGGEWSGSLSRPGLCVNILSLGHNQRETWGDCNTRQGLATEGSLVCPATGGD